MSNLTIRIPEELKEQLKELCEERNRALSDVVRESLRRYIAVERFRMLRHKTLPFAEAQGFVTDEDIFEAIS